MNSSQAFSQSRMIAAYFLPQVPVSWSRAGPGRVRVHGGVDGLDVARGSKFERR